MCRRGLWKKDRRGYSVRVMWLALFLSIVCYFGGIMAADTMANTHHQQQLRAVAVDKAADTDVESLSPHSVVLIKTMAAMLAATFGGCMTLLGFLYLSGQRATRKDIGEVKASMEKGIDELKANIKDLYEKKLDKEVHTQLCSILQMIKNGKKKEG